MPRRLRTVLAVALLAGAIVLPAAGARHKPTVQKFPAAGDLSVGTLVARAEPSQSGRPLLVLHQFRADYRLQVVLAVDATRGKKGGLWYRLSLPMRPNGTYGWVPASSVELHPVNHTIVIDRARRTLEVVGTKGVLLHTKVAVGAPGMVTPKGHFYVTARFVPNEPFYGVFALETSAYSNLSEWPGGGVVGIHGTNQPQLLGKAVSHGCVRVSNQAAAALKRLAPLGTPIVIKG